MATANSVSDVHSTAIPARAGLVVFVAPMDAESLENLFANLTALFPPEELLIATPNDTSGTAYPALRIVSTQATNAVWPLAAIDFANAAHAAKEHEARAILMLGPGAESLSESALRDLAGAVSNSTVDLGGASLFASAERRTGKLRHPVSVGPRSVRITSAVSAIDRYVLLDPHG